MKLTDAQAYGERPTAGECAEARRFPHVAAPHRIVEALREMRADALEFDDDIGRILREQGDADA